VSLIDFIAKLFARGPDKFLTDVPRDVRAGLERYIEGDEEILYILRTMRAVYKAPSWRDSNQLYRAWIVLTTKRVLILKNSSGFKLFRDVPLNGLKHITYDAGDIEYKITFESPPDSSDTVEFLGEAAAVCPHFRELLDDLSAPSGLSAPPSGEAGSTVNYCPHCGVHLTMQGNFCHECGAKLSP